MRETRLSSDSYTRSEEQDAGRTLWSQLQEHAERAPDAPFITHLASGVRLSYAQAQRTTKKLLAVLSQLGVGRKDKVVLLLRNHWLFFPLLIACSARRAILVPVDPDLHRDELSFILEEANPALTIHADGAPPPKRSTAAIQHPISELLTLIESQDGETERDSSVLQDTVLLIYTSGTLGTNKCVMLTSQNLASNAASLVRRYEVGAADRFFCMLPTHHMNAIMITGMVPFFAGAEIFLSEVFSFKNAKNFWKLLAAHGITICSLVPSIMALLLKLFPEGPNAPLPALRFGFCGAAPLPAQTWKRFEDTFRFPIHQGYGLTETTCWAASSLPDGPRHFDSVGVPLDCEIKIDSAVICDADVLLLEPVEQNTREKSRAPSVSARGLATGEVLIKGPIVTSGYFKNLRLTKESLMPDGFFRTGDLGYFDPEGRLHISGRIKEIVIRNGVNIFSAAVDAALAEHPAVEASKTFGLRDELVGERVCSACVLKAGAAVSEQALGAWLKGRLSRHLWPDTVVFLGYLPAGPAGKVSTGVLRRIVSGELADEMVASLNSWKYKRAQPSRIEGIRATIQRALNLGAPISFLAYWGCGTRDAIAEVDRMALERLKEFVDNARRVPQAPPLLTLIFTDTHARNNQLPEGRVTRYFAAVSERARALGMETTLMSELCTGAGLGARQIEDEILSPASEAAWQAHPRRQQLIEQAAKHVEQGADIEARAKAYFVMTRLEGRIIAEQYPFSILVTYNSPEFDFVLPPLPTVYLNSYKDGTAVKPWFANAVGKD